MQKLFRCFLFAVAVTGVASVAAAGELTVKIADGRATVIAKDVPVRQILAEWARVGNTKVVGAEKLMGGPISLELVDVPEKDALDILLRSAAGYLAAPRPPAVVGASQFDRVLILATSRPPAATASVPQPFNVNRPALTQMPQPPPDDDNGEPSDGPNPPPGMQGPVPPPGMATPGMPVPPAGMQNPNAVPNQPQQPPMTAPRPGLLPQPQQQVPPNPYAPGGRGIPGRPPGGGESGQ
jgi:hypothetical protein